MCIRDRVSTQSTGHTDQAGMFGQPATGTGEAPVGSSPTTELVAAPTEAPAAAAGGLQHTWTTPGSLGLKLKQRGPAKESPDGVIVSEITNPEVPAKLKGLVLETIGGENVLGSSYDEVIKKVKGAGRPLTITFCDEESAAAAASSAPAASLACAPACAEAAAPAEAEAPAGTEHTWTEPGSLGLKLAPIGTSRQSPGGVIVSEITNSEVPAKLQGLVLETIGGENVLESSYDEVFSKVKAGGRPLTIAFAWSEAAAAVLSALEAATPPTPAPAAPAAPAAAPSGLFGQSAAPPAGGLFGAAAPAAGGLFGASAPASAAPSGGGGLFGATSAASAGGGVLTLSNQLDDSSGVFGAAPAAAPSDLSTAAAGGFGAPAGFGAQAAAAAGGFGAPAGFGAQAPAAAGGFGAPAGFGAQAAAAAGGFGAPAGFGAQAPAAAGGFGAPAGFGAQAAGKRRLGSDKTAISPQADVFGSTTSGRGGAPPQADGEVGAGGMFAASAAAPRVAGAPNSGFGAATPAAGGMFGQAHQAAGGFGSAGEGFGGSAGGFGATAGEGVPTWHSTYEKGTKNVPPLQYQSITFIKHPAVQGKSAEELRWESITPADTQAALERLAAIAAGGFWQAASPGLRATPAAPAGGLFGAPAAPPTMPGAPVAAGGMHGQAGGMFAQPAAAAGMFGVVSDAPCQSWSAVEVGDWFRSLNFGDFTQTYADSFKAMGVEGGDLQFIDEQGLYEFGIRSKVHRHKILRKISTLLS
eukprot:TRINITY_DN4392_c0_g2_i12.p1 TRINITY_DN4392_c0_g2~~TRINITY_DN4392_c0_g2_i12.p1  ORF type:complete len:751 (+),score=201.14 TRINITY_DN4392_c0_g2_i12:117-2369(+)